MADSETLWTVAPQAPLFMELILQARILEWVDIRFSRGSSQCRIEPGSPALEADSLPLSHLGSPHRHILLIDRNNH